MNAATKSQLVIAPKVALAVTTALASVALAGCTTAAAPRAETSFNKAQTALAQGKVDKAVMHAEAAVLADPRNAGYRAMMGAAYLESGRFNSAATSFDDAIALGDTDPRTVLSYALAKVALGDNAAAVEKLDCGKMILILPIWALRSLWPEKLIAVFTLLATPCAQAKTTQRFARTWPIAMPCKAIGAGPA